MKLDAGNRLGRYELIRKIGAGGMADIFLARAAGLSGFEKPVVLKVLRERSGEDYVAEFLDEARLAARLSHPNVVTTFEVGNDGGRYFMVMEYVQGESLAALRAAPGGLGLEPQLGIIMAVLSALEHAHGLLADDGTPLGVVHRDVSASNVMVTTDGHVKLVDFGVARARSNRHTTRAGTIKGTLRYVAPETMRGDNVDHRADLYAVGVLLWEALTGERFLGNQNAASIMLRVASGDVPAPSEVCEVSPILDLIATRSLAPTPAGRFPSARGMRLAMLDYVARREPFSEEALAALVRKAASAPAAHLRAPSSLPPPMARDSTAAVVATIPQPATPIAAVKLRGADVSYKSPTGRVASTTADVAEGPRPAPPARPDRRADEEVTRSVPSETLLRALPEARAPRPGDEVTRTVPREELTQSLGGQEVAPPASASDVTRTRWNQPKAAPASRPRRAPWTGFAAAIMAAALAIGLGGAGHLHGRSAPPQARIVGVAIDALSPSPAEVDDLEWVSGDPAQASATSHEQVPGAGSNANPTGSTQGATRAEENAKTVTINLGAYPRTAILRVDGQPVDGNPALVTFEAGTKHTVAATAEGFRKKTLILDFDEPRTVDLTLSARQRRGDPQN